MRSPGSEAFLKLRREIKSTKTSVASVSKAWRAVALPFLFESLAVRLDDRDVGLSKDELPLAFICPKTPLRHVRRLKVFYSQRRPKATQDMYDPLLALCALACQNLTHLSLSVSPGPPSLLSLILAKCGISLRCLKLSWISLPSNFPEILMAAAPCLECLLMFEVGEKEIGSGVTITLPSLHSLEFHGRLPKLIDNIEWHLPRLLHLSINSRTPDVLSSIARFPRRLTTLALPFSPVSLGVLDSYPELKSFHFTISDTDLARTPSGTYPSPQWVSVAFARWEDNRNAPPEKVLALLSIFSNKMHFPAIKYIQCNVACLEECLSNYPAFIEELRARKIRVGGWEGDI